MHSGIGGQQGRGRCCALSLRNYQLPWARATWLLNASTCKEYFCSVNCVDFDFIFWVFVKVLVLS